MSTLKAIGKFIFGDWQEVYITTKEDEFHRLIGLLKDNKIKYRYTIKKPTKDNNISKHDAFYIDVLSRDYHQARKLFNY